MNCGHGQCGDVCAVERRVGIEIFAPELLIALKDLCEAPNLHKGRLAWDNARALIARIEGGK